MSSLLIMLWQEPKLIPEKIRKLEKMYRGYLREIRNMVKGIIDDI